MEAVGQETCSQEFYVNSWQDARSSNSSIILKQPTADEPLALAPAKREVCSDNWLHTIAEYEKNAPDTRLLVIGCAFAFHKLNLEIKGGKGFEDVVSARPLRIPYVITLSNEIFPAKG